MTDSPGLLGTDEPVVHPSREDPLVGPLTEGVGGPVGEHHAPHRWWTPVRVLLAVATLVLAAGMVQKAPCVADDWAGGNDRYSSMCYSDVPYLYTGRGLAELVWPYSDTGGRYPGMEYPVAISYVAFGAAVATHVLTGAPDLLQRATEDPESLWSQPEVQQEIDVYTALTMVLLAAAGLLAVSLLAGVHRRRPWDAMAVAASPALLLTWTINWDLLSVAAVAGALWAWARGRPWLTGVAIGVGTATKLYPLFLLGAVLVLCLRRWRDVHRSRTPVPWPGHPLADAGRTVVGAASAWVALQVPAWLSGFDQWRVFWTFNTDRGADLGSLWLVWQERGHTVTEANVNLWSVVAFAVACFGVAALGLFSRTPPRLAQLGYLVVVAFLVVNKVYSPQYVLWLLPLAALARPRWRDLLVWQAGEIFYFAMVWFYLGGFTASGTSGAPDAAYAWAVTLRVAAELYLAVVVVRDVLWPRFDPVASERSPARPRRPRTRPVVPDLREPGTPGRVRQSGPGRAGGT